MNRGYRHGQNSVGVSKQKFGLARKRGCNERRASTSMSAIINRPFAACLISWSLLFCVTAWAQLGVPSASPVSAPPEGPQDVLGRGTPRGTVLGFLSAARKGEDETAAQYLN